MNTNEFDSLLRDQFEDGEFDFKPAQWDRMVIDLNAAGNVRKKKNRILPVLGIAAALAAVLVCSAVWLLRKPAMEIAQIAPATQKINPSASATTEENKDQNNNNGETEKGIGVAGNTAVAVHMRPAMHHSEGVEPVPPPVLVGDTATPAIVANTTTEKQPAEKPKKNYDKVDLSSVMGDYPDEIKRTKKLSVGVTGGVNYGSSSSGYMAGVNARQQLGGKFYVDGDLAVISSKNLQNTANYSPAEYNTLNSYAGTDHTGTNTGPGTSLGNTTAPPKGQAVTNLYYLQFAPTLGYQLVKKVSVGVGADFQRKLQDEDTKTVVSDNLQSEDDIKLVPNMDVGVTGKAEYAITKKLKAGVLYRGGVNSWIDPKYVNRNYMQVQLKFMIFGK